MSAIITEKFRQHNANQFNESFTETAGNAYYLFLGKATPFTSGTTSGSDSSPPTPQDGEQDETRAWDSMLAAKKITSSDITFAIPRRNWANGTTYDIIEHPVTDGIDSYALYSWYNATLSVTGNAIAVINDVNGVPHVAVSELSDGLVVAMAGPDLSYHLYSTGHSDLAINSVASLQFEIPPMADIGKLFVSESFAISVTICKAIGLTAGPQ